MEYCSSKPKQYKKKKCGKCCNRTFIKRLPYATIATASSFEDGDSILVGSVLQLPVNTLAFLWNTVRPVGSPTGPGQTCLNGPLKTWFDIATGRFTVREAGMYSISVMGALTEDPTGATGTFYIAAPTVLTDVNKRCQNPLLTAGNTQPLEPTDSTLGGPPLSTTIVRPLLVGDIVFFVAYLDVTGVSAPIPAFFEIEIVQLSRLDKSKIEETMIVTE